MAERKFKLSAPQVNALRRAQDEASAGPLRMRLQAVRLYGTGYPLQTILDVTDCSISRLREWVQLYHRHGIDALSDHRCGGNSAKLTRAQRQELEVRLHQYTPHDVFGTQTHTAHGQFWTGEDLQRIVRRWYGIEYQSRVSYYNLLHACGFSFQRTEKVFRSQRPAETAAFHEQLEKN